MALVSMGLTVLGSIPLRIWVFVLPGTSDCVTHGFHDGYAFDGLYIEGVLQNLSLVALVRWAVIGLSRWSLKWTTAVVYEYATWIGRVGLYGM